MKRHIYTQTAILAAALTLAACVKDDQPVQNDSAPEGGTVISLNVEQPVEDSTGAPAQKVVFNGSRTSWGAGDRLWVNGSTSAVSNNRVTVNIPTEGYLLAVTDGALVNASNYATFNNTNANLTIAYPRSYTYSSSNNYTGLPLLGVAERTASSIDMKQLCTMVKVVVSNSLDKPITVTSIEVSSDRQVSGNVPVNLSKSGSDWLLKTAAGTSTAEADKKVTLSNINAVITNEVTNGIAPSKTFYVPIAPSGNTSSHTRKLTVKVNLKSDYALPAGVISHEAITTQYGTFSKTMETATLQRRAYTYEAFASITLRSQDGIVDPYFATNNGAKLYLSMGNLVAYYRKNTNNNTEQYYYAMLDVGESLANDPWPYNNSNVFFPSAAYGSQYNYDIDAGHAGLYNNPYSSSERYNHYGTYYLFSYGTSRWNSGASIYKPWQNQSTTSSDYRGDEGTSIQNKRDWGYGVERNPFYYMATSNPRYNHWTTPTQYEWLNYIVGVDRHAYAKITNVPTLGTVNGMIVLPLNYNGPRPLTMANGNDPVSLQYINSFTLTQWQEMRRYGAVFLPIIKKYRNGTNYSASASNKMTLDVNNGEGCYWTSDCRGNQSDRAVAFRFNPYHSVWRAYKAGVCNRNYDDDNCSNTNSVYISYGLQVRLARWSSGEN